MNIIVKTIDTSGMRLDASELTDTLSGFNLAAGDEFNSNCWVCNCVRLLLCVTVMCIVVHCFATVLQRITVWFRVLPCIFVYCFLLFCIALLCIALYLTCISDFSGLQRVAWHCCLLLCIVFV